MKKIILSIKCKLSSTDVDITGISSSISSIYIFAMVKLGDESLILTIFIAWSINTTKEPSPASFWFSNQLNTVLLVPSSINGGIPIEPAFPHWVQL